MQFFSGIFAFAAAVAWLWASLTKTPPLPASPQNIDAMYAAIGSQSRRNALAALFAGIAALFQFVLALMPACWSGAPWFG
jgi:hypothetical protein